jgi:ABC-2 type transport system permease protein
MISSQGTFVPIIIFVIIIMASQMIVTAISTEKIDKTLETLLSTPISRVSILTAKMLSAGIVSLISAVVYMLGFSISMGSVLTSSTEVVGEVTGSAISTQLAMISLGLVLTPLDYLLIGIDIFLSIMIALSLSLMLGVMVNDVKSTQLVVMPVMLMAMIPYLISYFVDINSLSTVLKVVLSIIPFTHTFNATNNLLFDNTSTVMGGIVYQIVFFVICMFFAVKLFKSDKILTASLNFTKKKKDSNN